ncbi:hypothetical protein BDK51DRAFT_19978, partial [Blyttiomyces helicus]
LLAKRTKITLYAANIPALGYELSRDGLHHHLMKAEYIRPSPTPHSKQDVSSFLGLVNYLQKFMLDVTNATRVLHCLSRKDTLFQ